MRNDIFSTSFSLFCREKWFGSPMGLLFNKFGNLSIYYIWNIQASNISWAPCLKCFGISLFDFAIFDFIILMRHLSKNSQWFTPLTCASICTQRTFAMAFSEFVIFKSCKCRKYHTGLAEIVQYEKSLHRPLSVFFADKKWFDLL